MVYTRRIISAIAAAVTLGAAPLAYAHHGWAWAETETFDLTGTVKTAKLGNPHGQLTLVTASKENWTIEVGQPWRNEQAGLKDSMLAPGAKLTIHGNRSKDHTQRLMKAVTVTIDGKNYKLYPERA